MAIVLHPDAHDLSLGEGELHLELGDLLLEVGDGTDAAVDRISHPCVGLVHQAAHRIHPLMCRQLLRL
jgi:hypothetical protein